MNNMTALVSCFARYYHTKTDEAKIFDDPLAGEILSESEKNAIAENMKNGIAFFDPNYSGGDPLGRVMNSFIAPTHRAIKLTEISKYSSSTAPR